jgi:hypothetical protein
VSDLSPLRGLFSLTHLDLTCCSRVLTYSACTVA